MSAKRYPEEFKIEAVKQIVDRGYPVAEVAKRLDVTTHSLYAWVKKYGPDSKVVVETVMTMLWLKVFSNCLRGKGSKGKST